MVKQLKISLRKKQEILNTLKKELDPDQWQIVNDVLEDAVRLGGVKIVDDSDTPSEP